MAKLNPVFPGLGIDAANAVIAVADRGNARPESCPGSHFGKVMWTFDDSYVLDEPPQQRQLSLTGVTLDETDLRAVDGENDVGPGMDCLF